MSNVAVIFTDKEYMRDRKGQLLSTSLSLNSTQLNKDKIVISILSLSMQISRGDGLQSENDAVLNLPHPTSKSDKVNTSFIFHKSVFIIRLLGDIR